MKAVLVLNGAPPPAERLQELAQIHPIYAADGGAVHCLSAGVRPEWVAGDLDSVSSAPLPEDWDLHHHPEQTRTDFQKVMADLPSDVQDILVLGGLGGRVDHQLTNLLLAAGFPSALSISFEHGQEVLVRVTPQQAYRKELPIGATLSLLPLTEAFGVTTSGLRWNLKDATMKAGGQLGQSNEVTGPVTCTVAQGSLFVWTLRT